MKVLRINSLYLLLLCLIVSGASYGKSLNENDNVPVDRNATTETKAFKPT